CCFASAATRSRRPSTGSRHWPWPSAFVPTSPCSTSECRGSTATTPAGACARATGARAWSSLPRPAGARTRTGSKPPKRASTGTWSSRSTSMRSPRCSPACRRFRSGKPAPEAPPGGARSLRELHVRLLGRAIRRNPGGRRLARRLERPHVGVDRAQVLVVHCVHVEPGHRRARLQRTGRLKPLVLRHGSHVKAQVRRVGGSPRPPPSERVACEPDLLVDL